MSTSAITHSPPSSPRGDNGEDSLKDDTTCSRLLPYEVKVILFGNLDFKSLVNLASTDKTWNQCVKAFFKEKINCPVDQPTTDFKDIYNLIWDLWEKVISKLEQHPFPNFRINFESISHIFHIPFIDLIYYLKNFPQAIDILIGWSQLCNATFRQLPLIVLPGPDTVKLITANSSSLESVLKALIEEAKKFNDWFKVHEEFLNARSILVVWEQLVLAVPAEHRENLERPGLRLLDSPGAVIAKATEFSAWFNIHRQVLIDHVVAFHLPNDQLTALPDEIFELIHLQCLNLRSNPLISIPKRIVNFQELRALALCSNKLDTFPVEVCQLTQLEELFLKANRFTSIPPQINNLVRLRTLDLRMNRLVSVPDGLGELVELTDIYLSDNQLPTLPIGIPKLPRLRILNVDNNPLLLRSRILMKIAPYNALIERAVGSVTIVTALAIGIWAGYYFGYLF